MILHNNDSGNGLSDGLFIGLDALENGFLYNNETGGELHLGTENSSDLVINASGHVGIGTTTPAFDLQVTGDVDITGELTAVSDVNLKKDIQGLQDGLDKINALNPVSYRFRTQEFPEMKLAEGQKLGLIAQEVEKVLPNLVVDAGTASNIHGDEIGIKSLNYMEMIPVLIKAVQELSKEVENLKSTVKALEAELASNEE